jgi:transposase InsO family protein
MTMFCELFGFTKQAYCKQKSNKQSASIEWEQVKHEVLQLRRQMPRLGTRKLHYMLKERLLQRQIMIGRDRLFRLLREEGLLVIRKRKSTITTNSKHWMRKYPNLVKNLPLTRPEQLWVADITYIDTEEQTGYLHLITDAYSKQIMGQELCDNMEASSTLKALKMALKKRIYHEPLIHHSDRGLQYCSQLYTQFLKDNAIQISMTENGDPYENAIAERMNGILKDEFGLGEKLTDIKEAIYQANESIAIYNNLRPHLSCSMLTPLQMHQQKEIKVKTWGKKNLPKPKGVLEDFSYVCNVKKQSTFFRT